MQLLEDDKSLSTECPTKARPEGYELLVTAQFSTDLNLQRRLLHVPCLDAEHEVQ